MVIATMPRLDLINYIADSPPGCSVEDWECIRGTAYIYLPMSCFRKPRRPPTRLRVSR